MRPTKYNEDVQKKAENYIEQNSNLWETYTEQRVNKWGKVENVDKLRPAEMPSKWNLAIELDVHRETLDDWGKRHFQFSDILEKIKVYQHKFLSYHGLTRGYDSAQSKMHQANLMGWSEKVEQKVEQKNIQINIDSDDTNL